MSEWVYYLREYPLGEFLVYRVQEEQTGAYTYDRSNPQVYHRKQGWIRDADLIVDLIKGDEIGRENIVSEKAALARIATLRRGDEEKHGE